MEPGASGAEVADLQRRLRASGHDLDGARPGVYDDATRAAVERFQADHGLVVTGRCDDVTWSALVESEHHLGERLLCLRSPMIRGDDVADLQLRLGALGFDAGRVDGIFGPTTQAAVAEFQRNAGLVTDAVCGPDTVQALHRLEGRAGRGSVTAVRERDRLRRGSRSVGGLAVAVASGADAESRELASGLAASLQRVGGEVTLLDGGWSAQAQAANDRGVEVVLGIEVLDEPLVEAAYFAVPGFESSGGRHLAELVLREVPAAPGWGIGAVRGLRMPILRETRSPAVLVRLGHRQGVRDARGLVIAALQRALDAWASDPC